jgi:hypothetical protein
MAKSKKLAETPLLDAEALEGAIRGVAGPEGH